ncbi:heavy metal translocating P-type ATPase [Streptococcus zalophi]|uniref:heavy metal translocating P-type ATPase n=1 Tax=Streptococcus zalophi TaxID=640031 RepID=UPI001BC8E3FF|nr:heavy metal translocating P-type ATPase [Streptococcus zalophi]
MTFKILHQNNSRIRVKCPFLCSYAVRDYLKELAHQNEAIKMVHFYQDEKTIAITVNEGYALSSALFYLKSIDQKQLKIALEKPYQKEETPYQIVSKELLQFAARRLFLPMPLQYGYTIYQATRYIKEALNHLTKKELTMEVLDGAAISTSILMGQFKTAGSIMFIMGLGDQLNDWSNKKSIEDLENSLNNREQMVWVLEDNQQKVEKHSKDIKENDIVIISAGNELLFDGIVTAGSGMVNESSLNGEFFPVFKTNEDTVYSNTILESGELYIKVTNATLNYRLHELMRLMRQSETKKGSEQRKFIKLADRLVKYNFLGVFLTYFLTGSFQKALSFLLVDFSCALKLSIPVSYLSAIKEAVDHDIIIKSMDVVENYNDIDLFVFDKTGTLTVSDPKVFKVIPFHHYSTENVIRIGACLEEHIHHPLATAVVQKAEEQHIIHEEMHGQLKHIASRGILSTIDDKQVAIGSYQLMTEQAIKITSEQEELIASYQKQYNLLYLGYDGQLIGIFLIDTPLREGAKEVIAYLQRQGKEVALLTGDTVERTQNLIGDITFQYIKTNVTPEDKYDFVKKQMTMGKKVMMIGDGLNDSAAISLATIGAVMHDAADISKQTSDLVLASNKLDSLLDLENITRELEIRVSKNVKETITINSSLILLGVFNLISPSLLSILHNLTTTTIILKSMSGFKNNG